MKQKIAILSILVNIILAGGKIIIGFVSSSSAVVADGFHSLTDIFSSCIGYFGIKISQKPVDQKHPYGYYKIEVLSGVVITLLLFITGLGIIYDAYKNFLQPENVKVGFLATGVMIFSIIINFITSKIKIYYGKKENSITLLSDGTHDKLDVLVSIVVLIGLFLSKYWIYTDILLALFVGLYIIKESFHLGKEATDSLLDVSAGEMVENKIRYIIKERGIELASLKTQKKGSVITANLEIKLKANLRIEEATKISDDLKKDLVSLIENLSYVSIQIQSYDISNIFYKPNFGTGFGWQRKGKFKETIQTAEGKGPNGDCVCPHCDYKIPHTKGLPCSTLQCPNCKINLERK